MAYVNAIESRQAPDFRTPGFNIGKVSFSLGLVG